MQTGGWMSEGTSQQQLAETKLSYDKSKVSVSISGQMLGCLQGFLIPKSSVKPSPQTESLRTSLYPVEKNVLYGADITLFPESLRKGDCPISLPRLISDQNNDNILQSSVEWAKTFSCPLLCSLQQVISEICVVKTIDLKYYELNIKYYSSIILKDSFLCWN
jgi:hypothetical protein